MAAQKRAELGDVLVANEEVRGMKRRLGIAEEALRIKKERLEDAVQEYDEEHKTFTIFIKRLEEKWEQRFDAVAALARASGVRSEDIEAARKQEWRAANAASNVAVPAEEIAAPEPSARSPRGAWLTQVRAEAAAAEAEAPEGDSDEGDSDEGDSDMEDEVIDEVVAESQQRALYEQGSDTDVSWFEEEECADDGDDGVEEESDLGEGGDDGPLLLVDKSKRAPDVDEEHEPMDAAEEQVGGTLATHPAI